MLLLLMIICYYWWLFVINDDYFFIIDDYWLLLMIIGCCNKTNCNSIYKEVIRPFFKLFIFFYDKIPQGKKALKGTINILVFSR